jgi:putative membrane protein
MHRAFAENRKLHLMLAWLAGFWLLTAIDPHDRFDWLLENLLVLIYGAILIATYRRFAFSNLSYALFTIFISLHLVGAHYTYSETPFGFWLQDGFDLSRNHYDRIVHFSFGLLMAYPFHELLTRAAGVRRSWSYAMVIVTVLGFSGFYEALEGVVAMIVSPELGAAYLGTQGDEWDAQKDTALAFAGSIVTMAIVWWQARQARRHGVSDQPTVW